MVFFFLRKRKGESVFRSDVGNGRKLLSFNAFHVVIRDEDKRKPRKQFERQPSRLRAIYRRGRNFLDLITISDGMFEAFLRIVI